jgi:hypothetical protein
MSCFNSAQSLKKGFQFITEIPFLYLTALNKRFDSRATACAMLTACTIFQPLPEY